MFEDDIESFKKGIRTLPSSIDKASAKAINRAARKSLTLAVNDIRKQVNLKPDYIRQNLKIYQFAKGDKLEAVIGAQTRGLLIDRFDGQQVIMPAKHPKRSKGDPMRGIASGFKSKGVTVKVKTKGSTKFIRGFYIPLKKGNGENGMGIAVRTGRGKKDYDVLHGPSVSQVFNTVRKDIEPKARQLAREELLIELESI